MKNSPRSSTLVKCCVVLGSLSLLLVIVRGEMRQTAQHWFARPAARVITAPSPLTARPPASAAVALNGALAVPQTVLAGGGGVSNGGTFAAQGAAGQSLTSQSSGESFAVASGFWPAALNATPTATPMPTPSPCATITLIPATLPNAQLGTAYGQSLSATPAANYSFAVANGALPSGLSLSSTGVISGIPTVAGAANFNVTVSSPGACAQTFAVTLTVNCPSLTLTPATLPNGVQGTAYTQSLSTTPAGTAYSYAVTTGVLPPGLTLASNGSLSGTPTAGGSYSFAVTSTGWGACSKTQSYNLLITGTCATITVNPATLSGMTVGQPYSQTLTATGGTAPYSFSLTQGALPPGLTLETGSGVLSGTATSGGSHSFRLTATAPGGCIGSRTYFVTVSCGTLSFTPATLPHGVSGAAYSQQLAVGASGAATFSLLLGSLPPGFTLSSAGLLSGMTSQTGTYNLTVKALLGTCQATQGYTLVIGSGSTAATPAGAQQADYDGDGKSDPTLWAAKDGVWRIVRSSDGQAVNQRWGMAGDVTLLGDYDGDSKSDLAVFRPADATFYIKRSSDGGTLIKAWGLSSDIPVPGDYDGDGKTDIAVWRGTEGNWYVLRSADGQTEVQAWGASYAPYLDVPVAGDYDGDGKTDLAVFRKGNGTWFIKRSRDGQMQSKLWGLGTDVPVAQDYDGDGQTDIAVWRPAAGVWYVLNSATNAPQTTAWGSGQLNDQTVPGDYDGDGKADHAVWRGADQTWYIRCSMNDALLTKVQGKAGDWPVQAVRR